MKKLAAFLIPSVLVILLLAAAMSLLSLMSQPLDPPLELTLPATEPVEAPAAAKIAPVQPANQAKTCGNSGTINLLLLGLSSPIEAGHPGADAIRLVVVDFDQVEARTMVLPADMWVATPADLLPDLGDTAPLNLIYLQAYQNASGQNEAVKTRKATQALAQTILDNFDYLTEKYLNLSGDAFIELVDILDGVTFTLEQEVDGTPEFYNVYPAGTHTYNGTLTLDFVRILHPAGGPSPDYSGRFQRQNLVILAIWDDILDPVNWPNAYELAKQARKMVVTDLSVDQVRDLTCMLDAIGVPEEIPIDIPELLSVDQQGHLIPDMEAFASLFAELAGK
jgi:anionic cell wall polymer biosynthesis LytR-Cps2A-Psr (LCP) family protein